MAEQSMRTGISYWSMPGGLEGKMPISDAIELAKQIGFDAMEFCIGEQGVLRPDTTQRECEELRSLVDSRGLVVETLASGMSWAHNPVSDDAATRKRSIALHKSALVRTSWLGCRAMLFVPGVVCSPISPHERVRYDHAVERCRVAVSELLETADEHGVDLCIENVWNGLFYSPLELAAFVDSFGSDRLGVYFDVGNVLGYQQHPPHWIELLGERIKRVHVKDYADEFGWQGSYRFCPLDDGDVPLRDSVVALSEIGYGGTVIAEMLPWTETLLADTRLKLDSLMASITPQEAAASS